MALPPQQDPGQPRGSTTAADATRTLADAAPASPLVLVFFGARFITNKDAASSPASGTANSKFSVLETARENKAVKTEDGVSHLSIYDLDSKLAEFKNHFNYRMKKYLDQKLLIEKHEGSLEGYSKGYLKCGINTQPGATVYRECPPAAMCRCNIEHSMLLQGTCLAHGSNSAIRDVIPVGPRRAHISSGCFLLPFSQRQMYPLVAHHLEDHRSVCIFPGRRPPLLRP